MIKATEEQIDAALNPIQAFAFRDLADSERSVERLPEVAKLTTLTNDQAIIFSRLLKVERTLVNLQTIASLNLTDDQKNTFKTLPDSERNMAKLQSMVAVNR